MNLHTSTRIPIDDAYAVLIGKAVYAFSYYEWSLIYLVEWLGKVNFVGQYSRGRTLTSDGVRTELDNAIKNLPASFATVPRTDLQAIQDEFQALIARRNALVHAHPVTDDDGSPISAYQARASKPITDMTWREADIRALISDIDAAASGTLSSVFEKLRPSAP